MTALLGVVLASGCALTARNGAVPALNAASDNAKKQACEAQQRMIYGAVQQYLAMGGKFEDISGPVDARNPLVSGEAQILRQAPKCLLGDAPYVLASDQTVTCPYGDPPSGHGRASLGPGQ